jgi:hypothetical protein
VKSSPKNGKDEVTIERFPEEFHGLHDTL